MSTVGTGELIPLSTVRTLSLNDGAGHVLTDQVIGAQFTYGSLGTCQGGTVTVTGSLPAGWGTRTHLITLNLEHATGTEPVFVGILDTPKQPEGALTQVPLLPPHTAYQQVPGGGLADGIVATASLAFGAPYGPYGPAHQPLIDALRNTMQAIPNADFGVGPDRTAGFGRPGSAYAAPILYVGDSTIQLENLGPVIPSYITHVVLDPGDGWSKSVQARQDIPPFVERRTATVSVGTKKSPVAQQYGYSSGTGVQGTYSHTGTGEAADYQTRSWAGQVPLPADTASARHSELVLDVPFELGPIKVRQVLSDSRDTLDNGADLIIDIVRASDYQWLKSLSIPIPAGMTGRYSAQFVLPPDLLGSAVNITSVLTMRLSHEITIRPLPMTLRYQRQVPDWGAAQMPTGWNMPFVTDPSYRVRVPGVHIPPLRVASLPGNLTQFAAGATVTWNANECYTDITTTAWPY